jgi:hypothetical protein
MLCATVCARTPSVLCRQRSNAERSAIVPAEAQIVPYFKTRYAIDTPEQTRTGDPAL